MKTNNYLSMLTIVATALSLNVVTTAAQSLDSRAPLKNRAIAASPRAMEMFPWLGRAPLIHAEACCAETATTMVAAKKDRTLVASPRLLEQFPELARRAFPTTTPEFTVAPLVEKGPAVLSHPRTLEEFPALSRGSTTGSARGGATKLMERGK